MSWSIQLIGKPAAVIRAIDDQAKLYTSPATQRELAVAIPALKTLVGMNGVSSAVKLQASGFATFDSNGSVVDGQANVTIEPIYGFME